MTPEELRARILASRVESVESELLGRLRELPEVTTVRATWFPGCLEITVVLAEWIWDAMERPGELINAFACQHVRSFSVTHKFEPPALRP